MRHEPPGLDADAVDAHTLDWVQRLNASGRAYITPAHVAGRWLATELEHVHSLWQMMQDVASETSA